MFMKIDFLHMKKPNHFSIAAACFLFWIMIFTGCKKQENVQPVSSDPESALAHNGSKDKTEVDKKLVADGFASPLGVVAIPNSKSWFDDNGRREDDDDHYRSNGKHDEREDKRLFVIDQVGKIWIIDAMGNKLPEPFLDIS